MTPAPLQLIDYWATSIHMDACADYDCNAPTKFEFESISVSPTVRLLDSPDPEKFGTRWMIGLSIEQAPCPSANIPYTFSIKIQGVVVALPELSGERLDRVIHANGPALLFGSAREMIRALTGRGPNGPVIIPSTNFLPRSPASAAVKPPEVAEGQPLSVKKTVKKKAPNRGPVKKAARKKSKE